MATIRAVGDQRAFPPACAMHHDLLQPDRVPVQLHPRVLSQRQAWQAFPDCPDRWAEWAFLYVHAHSACAGRSPTFQALRG